MLYSIHSSFNGACLIPSIELDSTLVENLSSDTPEGFFYADQLEEIAYLGHVSVYAIVH